MRDGRSRPKNPHFRKRGKYIAFCVGGSQIAAWPQTAGLRIYDVMSWPQTNTKKNIANGNLCLKLIKDADALTANQVYRLVLLLREALKRAQEGKRRKSATRQLHRLEVWIAKQFKPRASAVLRELSEEEKSAAHTKSFLKSFEPKPYKPVGGKALKDARERIRIAKLKDADQRHS